MKNNSTANENLTPIKAIRNYCVNTCMCGQVGEVRKCPITDCALFIYRDGHRPKAPVTYEASATNPGPEAISGSVL